MLYSPSNPPAHTLPVNRGEPHQVKFLSPKMGQESCFAGRSSWLWVCCGLLGGPGAVCSHPRDWPVTSPVTGLLWLYCPDSVPGSFTCNPKPPETATLRMRLGAHWALVFWTNWESRNLGFPKNSNETHTGDQVRDLGGRRGS